MRNQQQQQSNNHQFVVVAAVGCRFREAAKQTRQFHVKKIFLILSRQERF